MNSSNELCNNKSWFAEFHHVVVNNPDALKTIYEYLKSIEDMDKFGELEKPISDYQLELVELSKCPILGWVEDLPMRHPHVTEIELTCEESYNCFRLYCERNGIKYEVDSIKLVNRVGRLVGVEKFIKKSVKNGKKPNRTVFDLEGLRNR